nr:peptidoglycan recognition family protein [Bailinhaonella thermotolerans]
MRRPKIYTRADWGARPPRRRAVLVNKRPEYVVVHHTASGNTKDYGLDRAFQLSRAIQAHHMKNNGWEDTGQHFTISRGGHIMEGRNRTLRAINSGLHAIGAHVANHNNRCVGIENEGNYTRAMPPDELLESLAHLTAWLCEVYDLNPYRAIIGHRDLNSTGCPGRLHKILPLLRREVAARLRRRSSVRHEHTLQMDVDMDLDWDESGPPFRVQGPASPFDHGPAIGPADITR